MVFCCITSESHPVTPLTDDDVIRIAKELEIPIYRFREEFVATTHAGRPIQHIKRLIGPCPFFTCGLCGIHDVKPIACKNRRPLKIQDGITCQMWERMRALGI
jgi:hypothetical protein